MRLGGSQSDGEEKISQPLPELETPIIQSAAQRYTTELPYEMGTGIKRPGREADHSPPCSADVTNAWCYTSTPRYVFMAWYLVKHRGNFIFYKET
jgi:hypothetical protein